MFGARIFVVIIQQLMTKIRNRAKVRADRLGRYGRPRTVIWGAAIDAARRIRPTGLIYAATGRRVSPVGAFFCGSATACALSFFRIGEHAFERFRRYVDRPAERVVQRDNDDEAGGED